MKRLIKKILLVALLVGIFFGICYLLNHIIPPTRLYQDGETFIGTGGKLIRVVSFRK